jgi:squalene synthase HpnC
MKQGIGIQHSAFGEEDSIGVSSSESRIPNAESPSLQSGKNRNTENFPVGSFLIRPDLRSHVHTLYNFARAADDISDHPLLEPQVKVARLDRFAEILCDENIVPQSGSPSFREDKIAAAMRTSLKETGITPQHCLDLLTAFKRDATQLRYCDWDDLIDYCRYSASPVGRHVLALHGVGKEAWPASDDLCNALQVINHIQDCADDYRELDRVYIPQDMMSRHGMSTAELAREKVTPALRATLDEMLAKLETMMPSTRGLPKHVPDWRLKYETSIIAVLAERLIVLLQKRDPLSENVKLGKIAMLGAALSGIGRAWR